MIPPFLYYRIEKFFAFNILILYLVDMNREQNIPEASSKAKKLNDAHKQFILRGLARNMNPSEIRRMLLDEDVGCDEGFKALEYIHHSSVYRMCEKIRDAHGDQIKAYRHNFLENLLDVRFVSKKERLMELEKIVVSDKSSQSEKIHALREFHHQCGDEVDDYLKAMSAVDGTKDEVHHYHHLKETDATGSERLHKNLAIIGNNTGLKKRFEPSNN